MSHYDYQFSQEPTLLVGPFYGLIMAAMRRADTNNLERLKRAFPQVWAELEARYNAPGGFIEGDVHA